jgi:thiamine monophosphate synthase
MARSGYRIRNCRAASAPSSFMPGGIRISQLRAKDGTVSGRADDLKAAAERRDAITQRGKTPVDAPMPSSRTSMTCPPGVEA